MKAENVVIDDVPLSIRVVIPRMTRLRMRVGMVLLGLLGRVWPGHCEIEVSDEEPEL